MESRASVRVGDVTRSLLRDVTVANGQSMSFLASHLFLLFIPLSREIERGTQREKERERREEGGRE